MCVFVCYSMCVCVCIWSVPFSCHFFACFSTCILLSIKSLFISLNLNPWITETHYIPTSSSLKLLTLHKCNCSLCRFTTRLIKVVWDTELECVHMLDCDYLVYFYFLWLFLLPVVITEHACWCTGKQWQPAGWHKSDISSYLKTSWAFEHSDPHKSSPGSRS